MDTIALAGVPKAFACSALGLLLGVIVSTPLISWEFFGGSGEWYLDLGDRKEDIVLV